MQLQKDFWFVVCCRIELQKTAQCKHGKPKYLDRYVTKLQKQLGKRNMIWLHARKENIHITYVHGQETFVLFVCQ